MSFFAQPVVLSQPPRIALGAGCSRGCAEEFSLRGVQRVLVVSSPRAMRAGEPILTGFKAHGLACEYFADVKGETTTEHVEAALRAARDFGAQGVLGLGGGSALDAAKLVAALLGNAQKLADIFGIGALQGRSAPVLCVPTTAGTGSEVSPNALAIDETGQKKAAISRFLVPDAAFFDPELMVGVPPEVTAATGMDALTHCIEGFANRFAHPAVDLYALQGVRLLSQFLPEAVRNGGDVEVREKVALGSLYGGLCLGPVNTAAVHALAYPLGSEFHVGHGLSNALLLPHVLRFNAETSPERYAHLAPALGLEEGHSEAESAQSVIEALEILADECGLPCHLRDVGVTEESLPRLASEAIKVQRLLKNNLREVSVQDAETIYRNAY